jgi:hypothetical protein
MIERHPAEEDLFLLADGTLGRFKSWRVRAHLKRCWTCRRLVGRHHEAINAVVEHRDLVQRDMAQFVPGMRARFSARLNEASQLKPERRRGTLLAWAAVAAAVVFLIVTFWRVPAISADSVIERASAAETKAAPGIQAPVVRQELKFRRRKSAASTLVVWTDLASGEQREDGRTPGWEHYRNILARNHVGNRRRMLAGVQQAWRRSIIRKSETVTGTDGALLVATEAEGPFQPEAITRMVLLVRTADWRPLRQTVYVQEAGAIEDYEVEEVAASVVARNSLPPGIFEAAQPARPSEAAAMEPAPRLPAAPSSISDRQSISAEIRARLLLHRLDACLGEPIEYLRGEDGRITVRGQVATEARKRELIHALASLAYIRTDLHSAERAVSGEALIAAGSPGEKRVPAAEAFGWIAPLQGLPLDSIRLTDLVNSSVPLSSSALDEAWALRRLAERFPDEAVAALDREDKATVETMLQDHREHLAGKISRLKQTLTPVLPGCADCKIAPAQEAGLSAAIMSQFQAVQEFDRTLSSLLAPVAPPVADPAPLLRSLSAALSRADQLTNVLRDGIHRSFPE